MILLSFLLMDHSALITTLADFLQDTYSVLGSSILTCNYLSYEMRSGSEISGKHLGLVAGRV